MPKLDMTNARNGAIGAHWDTVTGRFYNGSTEDRTLVRCPRCRRLMDPAFPHDNPPLPECERLAQETAEMVARLNKTSVPKGRGGMEATHG